MILRQCLTSMSFCNSIALREALNSCSPFPHSCLLNSLYYWSIPPLWLAFLISIMCPVSEYVYIYCVFIYNLLLCFVFFFLWLVGHWSMVSGISDGPRIQCVAQAGLRSCYLHVESAGTRTDRQCHRHPACFCFEAESLLSCVPRSEEPRSNCVWHSIGLSSVLLF